MARKPQNRNQHRQPPRANRPTQGQDIFEQQPGQRPENLRIPAESVELSASISNNVNQKVKSLVGGLTSLKQFYLKKDENEDFKNFFEENKEPIESLLKYDLNQTYNELVRNDQQRQRIYQEMEQKGVISRTELNHLHGIISPQPYTAYIKSLAQRTPPTPPAPVTPAPAAAPTMTPLTVDDQDNLGAARTDNIQIIVDRLKSENKITDDEGQKLIELGPKTDQQIKEGYDAIVAKIKSHDITANSNYLPQYLETLRKENELETEMDSYIDRYDHVVGGLVKQIKEALEADQYDQIRKSRIRELSRRTGLPLSPGQVLWSYNLENLTTGSKSKDNRVEITNISFGEEETDPDMLPEFRKKIPTLEPVIEFTLTTPDGKTESHQLAATTFAKWAARNQLSQKFTDLEELEKDLGIENAIRPGAVFEFTEPKVGATKEDEAVQLKTVKIEKIEDGIIYLDQSVMLDAGGAGSRSNPRITKEMDLGEFARWYKKTQAVPEFENLETLDKALEKHHFRLVQEMGWPANQGESIKLSDFSKPIHLVSAYDTDLPPMTIEKVDKNGVHIEDSGVIPLHQFYRLVREHGITIPTAEQLAELKNMAKAQNDDKRLEQLSAISGDQSPEAITTKSTETVTEPKIKSPGYFRRLWEGTTFLNLMEMYQLFIKAPSERISAWLKDNSERRVAKIGKEFYKGFPKFGGLNDLADSYEGTWNAKNSGDVKNLMEWFDNNNYLSGNIEAMYDTANKPTFNDAKVNFKAAIQLVIKKGVVRWEDDEKLMAAVNRLNVDGKYKYPDQFSEKLGGAVVVVGDKGALAKDPTLSIFDQYRAILDGVYGAGSFDSWSGQNEREYRSQREEAQNNMHKYEFMQGGIGRQLQKMLYDHEHSRPVNPAEFDGLLSQAIQKMEVTIEQGMLLLVSAFSVKNKNGQTLLPFSRLNPFVKDLATHQMYYFFAVGHNLLDENGNVIMEAEGKPKQGKFSLNNFHHLFNRVIAQDISASGKSDLSKYEAGKNTINWIQSEVLTNSLVKKQAANKAGNVDIDPGAYHYLGPLVWEEDNLDKIIGKNWGSSPKPDIAKNMYVGYNNQLIIRANRLNKGKNEEENITRAAELSQMVFSFLYFNHSIKGKINYNKPFLRLNEVQFADRPLADKKRRVKEFGDETESFVKIFSKGVARLSGNSDLAQMTSDILDNPSPQLDEDEESEFRNKLNLAIVELAKTHPAELAALAKQAASEMKGTSGAQLSHEEKQQMKNAA